MTEEVRIAQKERDQFVLAGIYVEELEQLARLLRRAGYLVVGRINAVTIEEKLDALFNLIEGLPAAVVAALPPVGQTPDVTQALADLKDAVSSLAAGQTVEETDLTKIQSAVDTVQATLGTPPAIPPPTA